MDELLTVEGVAKRFKDRYVLEDVSFSVRAGEVLGLIGPNGAGKTTLFAGKVGVWSKTDSVSYFDEFTVSRSSQ